MTIAASKPDFTQDVVTIPSTPDTDRVITIAFMGTGSSLENRVKSEAFPEGELISYIAQRVRDTNPEQEVYDYAGPNQGPFSHPQFYTDACEYNKTLDTALGWSMQQNAKDAINRVLGVLEKHHPNEPALDSYNRALLAGSLKNTTVNVIAWSRGAVTALKFASEMLNGEYKDLLKDVKINLCLVDPVPGPFNDSADIEIIHENVKNAVIFYATGERSVGFEAIHPTVENPEVTKLETHYLPGYHASLVGAAVNHKGEKIKSEAALLVGKYVRHEMEKFLNTFGTQINSSDNLTSNDEVAMLQEIEKNKESIDAEMSQTTYSFSRDYVSYFKNEFAKFLHLYSNDKTTDENEHLAERLAFTI